MHTSSRLAGAGASTRVASTSPPADGGDSSGGLGWLLAALGWGLFIASVLRQLSVKPSALPGTPSALQAGLSGLYYWTTDGESSAPAPAFEASVDH